MTFDQFLQYASGSGVAIIVGILLSLAAEDWAWYQARSPRHKTFLFWLACMVIPLIAVTLRGLMHYAPWSFDPLYWKAIVSGFVATGIGTVTHIPQKGDAPRNYVTALIRVMR